jgi:TatA/E family protein of Tat protein translocase
MQHLFFAFGLPHGTDFLWLFLLALIFFGGAQLPKLARGLGKSLGEFKKAKEEIEKEIHAGVAESDAKKIEDEKRAAASAGTATSTDEPTKKS